MKYILIMCILMYGCGGHLPCPSEWEADSFMAGMCVKTNGAPIDIKLVSAVVQKLEDETNATFPSKHLNLTELLYNHTTLLGYWGRVYTGNTLVRGNTIFPFKDPESGEWVVEFPTINVAYMGCMNTYYVTGHELLHFISFYHLNTSRELSRTHMVEDVFITWANANELALEFSIEGRLFNWIPELCNEN